MPEGDSVKLLLHKHFGTISSKFEQAAADDNITLLGRSCQVNLIAIQQGSEGRRGRQEEGVAHLWCTCGLSRR